MTAPIVERLLDENHLAQFDGFNALIATGREAADTITDLLELLNECADFVQPFNKAEDLLDRIEAAIAKAKAS